MAAARVVTPSVDENGDVISGHMPLHPDIRITASAQLFASTPPPLEASEQSGDNEVPNCSHPDGTTLGHDVSPTPMWAVRRGTEPVWYCPDCNRNAPRTEP